VIDLYYWATPNGHKITIALEELGLAYRLKPVNINKGEQFDPAFLLLSPNNRIPAIVDDAPADRGEPLSIFESGAILTYLAEKTGRLMPSTPRGKAEVMQWLFWQVGGLGPMAGQNHHFVQYAPEKIPYAIERYVKETGRLYRVLDGRLADRPYVAVDYSIADIAAYTWVVPHERQQMNLDDFPNLKRWFATIAQRPAVERAYALASQVQSQPLDDAARKVLFGQSGTGRYLRASEPVREAELRVKREEGVLDVAPAEDGGPHLQLEGQRQVTLHEVLDAAAEEDRREERGGSIERHPEGEVERSRGAKGRCDGETRLQPHRERHSHEGPVVREVEQEPGVEPEREIEPRARDELLAQGELELQPEDAGVGEALLPVVEGEAAAEFE
jgi:GST-like protein